MLRHVIFDFGNVLARFAPREMVAQFADDPADIELLTETVFDRLYWDKADAGTITDDETKEAFCARLPERLHKTACAIYDAWPTLLPPIDGMVELVQELKSRDCSLYLLSNISTKFAAEYTDIPWLAALFSQFDGLVFSAEVGFTKPHRDIFEYVLRTYELSAEDCLFIDDSPINIDGARAVGIQGQLFDGDVASLRTAIMNF